MERETQARQGGAEEREARSRLRELSELLLPAGDSRAELSELLLPAGDSRAELSELLLPAGDSRAEHAPEATTPYRPVDPSPGDPG